MNNLPKLFFLDQHGCAKNQVDGELLIGHLQQIGWQMTESIEEASLIIVNSCGFIEDAKVESINSVIEAKKLFPNKKVLLCGCLAERYAEDFATDFHEADAILGNGDISKIKDIISHLFLHNGVRPITTRSDRMSHQKQLELRSTTFDTNVVESCANPRMDLHNGDRPRVNIKPLIKSPQVGVCSGDRPRILNFKNSIYIKITEGCNNCCSFCAIPLIRGDLRSRPIQEIVEEIKTFLDKGYFEFNLIGQDLAAFGLDGVEKGNSFAKEYFEYPSPLSLLLKEISKLQGDFWIRLLYIHPDHFPHDCVPVIKADSRILPYFDIPFQSGSDFVLKAMNRKASSNDYKHLVASLRKVLPNVVIRTTFLCGFPGETPKNAKETEEFLKEIKPTWSGCFAYSKEEDTPAFLLENQNSLEVSKKRVAKLNKIQENITSLALQKFVGQQTKVLIEEIIDDTENNVGIALARAWFQAPDVDGVCVVRYELEDKKQKQAMECGNVVNVKIIGVNGVDLDTLALF